MTVKVLVGFFSGIISGMGIGGGTILIPALVFIEGIGQQQAQSVNLLYFVPTALIALFFHKKNDSIEVSVVKPIVLFGLIGAAAGAFLAVNIEADLLKKLFGAFLLVMGITEVFKKEKGKNGKGSIRDKKRPSGGVREDGR